MILCEGVDKFLVFWGWLDMLQTGLDAKPVGLNGGVNVCSTVVLEAA